MKNQPDGVIPWMTFAKDHLILFSTLVPISVATIRILYASEGNLETLRAIVTNIEILQLVLGTMLPIIPPVVFLIGIEVIDWYFTKKKQHRPKIPQWVAIIWPFPLILSIIFTPLLQLAIFCIIASTIAFYRGRFGLNYGRHAVKYRTVYSGIAGLVIFQALFTNATMWSPTENIQFKNGTQESGNILSTDIRWTTFLPVDGVVKIYSTPELESRTPCSYPQSAVFKSAASLLSGVNYPTCSKD